VSGIVAMIAVGFQYLAVKTPACSPNYSIYSLTDPRYTDRRPRKGLLTCATISISGLGAISQISGGPCGPTRRCNEAPVQLDMPCRSIRHPEVRIGFPVSRSKEPENQRGGTGA
jgi:hypothetical protein